MRHITIDHNGKTYSGQIGTIRRTRLGSEDHGVVTAWTYVEWQGGGIGVGGYCLDEPQKDENGKHLGRVGSAYGLDYLMQVMDTVGVANWEDLAGRDVIVLFEGKSMIGSTAAGIAGVTNDKVFIPAEHAAKWIEESAVSGA